MKPSEYLAAARWLRRLADGMEAEGDTEFAVSARAFADHHVRQAHDALAGFSKRRQQEQARQRIAEFGRQLRRDQAVRDARARIGR